MLRCVCVCVPLAWSLSSWVAVFFQSSILSWRGVTRLSIKALWERLKRKFHKFRDSSDATPRTAALFQSKSILGHIFSLCDVLTNDWLRPTYSDHQDPLKMRSVCNETLTYISLHVSFHFVILVSGTLPPPSLSTHTYICDTNVHTYSKCRIIGTHTHRHTIAFGSTQSSKGPPSSLSSPSM